MRSLPEPDRKDGMQFRLVYRHYNELKSAARAILKAYRAYARSSAQGMMPIGLNGLQKEQMEQAYRSKAKSAGLDWINNLHGGHSLNFCPLCGGPGCRTIDHHLPDASYPEFSVFSKNLVPSCSTCNPKRNNSNKKGSPLLTLSPYFDGSLLDSIKLVTTISPPYSDPTFTFTLKSTISDPALCLRAQNHIETCLDLAAFKTWTRGQWSDIYSQSASRHTSWENFRDELVHNLNAETSLGNGNSWNASLVRGMLLNPDAARWMIDNPLALSRLSSEQLGLD